MDGRNPGNRLFVGIDRGIIILGLLRWCRISSTHSTGPLGHYLGEDSCPPTTCKVGPTHTQRSGKIIKGPSNPLFFSWESSWFLGVRACIVLVVAIAPFQHAFRHPAKTPSRLVFWGGEVTKITQPRPPADIFWGER